MIRNSTAHAFVSIGVVAVLTAFTTPSIAQQPVPGSREAMWPAPTAEDWAKPCLITWERSFEDAQAVARETGKPILVCVNMDGEIASEHYAGIRYRQPDIAKLYEPYVCVIASVYRHNPRDYDEAGQRLLCPRFGSVTCGEHILVEPQLFDGFFEDQRVAPRHIGVELDGSEMYDVFYAFDTDSVFAAIEDGVADRPQGPSVDRGDRPIVERVDSAHSADRIAVERAYREGDRDTKRALLSAALAQGQAASPDLLRLAIFGLDVELAATARRALAGAEGGEKTAALIAEALHVPLEEDEREQLIAALERCDEVPWARPLAVTHRGLGSQSSAVDASAWARTLSELEPTTEPPGRVVEAQLDRRARAATERPDDPNAQLELAEAFLAMAVDPETDAGHAGLFFADARTALGRARELGAEGWRERGASALLTYYAAGDRERAWRQAEEAITGMPPGDYGWNAMALLGLFAEGRQAAIRKAVRDKEDWPPQWFTDVHAAYSALEHHPLGTDAEFVAHYDFLRRLGAGGQAWDVLRRGLSRFPDSWELHARLRGRALWEGGAEGLERTYRTLLVEDTSPNLPWFAGYASLVAAESHRRAGHAGPARASYARAIAHYQDAIERNAESRATADHYSALALAGQARLALEAGEFQRSLTEILASFERHADAAASLDGLNISPVGTAQMLRSRLEREGFAELAERLGEALDALDPELLLLPEFERQGPARPGTTTGRRR